MDNDDEYHGYGILKVEYPNKREYFGQFFNGKRHGKGLSLMGYSA